LTEAPPNALVFKLPYITNTPRLLSWTSWIPILPVGDAAGVNSDQLEPL
jgi:hypothetical protein